MTNINNKKEFFNNIIINPKTSSVFFKDVNKSSYNQTFEFNGGDTKPVIQRSDSFFTNPNDTFQEDLEKEINATTSINTTTTIIPTTTLLNKNKEENISETSYKSKYDIITYIVLGISIIFIFITLFIIKNYSIKIILNFIILISNLILIIIHVVEYKKIKYHLDIPHIIIIIIYLLLIIFNFINKNKVNNTSNLVQSVPLFI